MAPGRHLHHLTGRRTPGGTYAHRALVVPLLPVEHRALHEALRSARLDFPEPGEDILEFWRRRLGFSLRLLAARGQLVTFWPPALAELADVVDGGCP